MGIVWPNRPKTEQDSSQTQATQQHRLKASYQQDGTVGPAASQPRRAAPVSSDANEQHGDLDPVAGGVQASAQEGALS